MCIALCTFGTVVNSSGNISSRGLLQRKYAPIMADPTHRPLTSELSSDILFTVIFYLSEDSRKCVRNHKHQWIWDCFETAFMVVQKMYMPTLLCVFLCVWKAKLSAVFLVEKLCTTRQEKRASRDRDKPQAQGERKRERGGGIIIEAGVYCSNWGDNRPNPRQRLSRSKLAHRQI